MRMLALPAFFVIFLMAFAGCKSDAKVAETTPVPAQAPVAVPTPTSAPAAVTSVIPQENLIPVGERAPGFEATDQTGKHISLGPLLRTKNIVLIFYPGDDTPGCTKQLCAVRDDWSKFQDRNTIVLGVNPAGVTSHANFAQKYNFPFPVLSDSDGKISAAYGATGKNPDHPQRTVYVIRRTGRVAFAERGMVPHEKIFAILDN